MYDGQYSVFMIRTFLWICLYQKNTSVYRTNYIAHFTLVFANKVVRNPHFTIKYHIIFGICHHNINGSHTAAQSRKHHISTIYPTCKNAQKTTYPVKCDGIPLIPPVFYILKMITIFIFRVMCSTHRPPQNFKVIPIPHHFTHLPYPTATPF